jgi:methionyl-tRNA synthetase
MSLFGGVAPVTADTTGLAVAVANSTAIRDSFEQREFSKAIRLIMDVADAVNQEIAGFAPWVLAKSVETDPESKDRLAQICASSIAAFKLLTLFLKPILPNLAIEAERYLNCDPLQWNDAELPLSVEKFLPVGHAFGQFRPLMTRVEEKHLDALFDIPAAEPAKATKKMSNTPEKPAQSGSPAAATQHPTSPGPAAHAAAAAHISIDDFAKVDLRVAKIVKAEHVEGADKLLKLTLDIGSETRTVFAGIKSAYDPAKLEGRLTVMVANLAPRKMKFGLSEGMVLAASDDSGGSGDKNAGLFILSPDAGAAPGMKVK